MNGRLDVDPRIVESRVVAILRGDDGRHLLAVADALVEVGVCCIEVTANTPGAADGLAALRARHGESVVLGYGTARSVADVEVAARLGVGFVVAPNTVPEVGAAARSHGLGWFPGALTPTEIENAWSLGATAVKVFPAAQAGGPGYLRAVRAPLDDVPLLPTGGIGTDEVADYLTAGAVAVGLGSPLIGDALRTGDTSDVRRRAGAALDAARGVDLPNAP